MLVKALILVPALLLVAGVAPAADLDVVINEVFYTGGSSEDWFELKNTGPDTVDVSSWVVCARFDYPTFASLTILDGNDLILAPDEIDVDQADAPHPGRGQVHQQR